tara:strand:+ start:323 stop:988 length:666 start_codon:yes stop_codon:yes gene_type:complete
MTTILALDTTTTNCSAALMCNGETYQELSTMPRVHNEKILQMVNNVLQKAQITMQQLDYLALSIGPGSFTGVRLGVSIAQGLAMGANLKIIPVSSLHAVAHNLSQKIDTGQIVVAFDARMQQVYWSSYDLKDVYLQRKTPDQLSNPQDLALSGEFYATGDGFLGYESCFDAKLNYKYIALEPNSNPKAKHVAAIAANMTANAIAALELEPVYLRNNVAQKS